MVEVRQARYFLAVADTLHFGRAAQALHMSQPPLSQAIMQLERQLGARLFDRGGRGVALTETGRAFAEECRALLAASHRARRVAAQAEAGLTGTLRIGVVIAALSEPMLGALAAFQAERPRVELRVLEVDTPQGQQALLRRDIDVAVIRLSSPGRSLVAQPWRRDRFVVAVPVRHAAAVDQPVDLADLADEPWVWLHRDASPDYHDQLMQTCRRAGFTPDVRHYASTITTQLTMVGCGLGITLVPDSASQPPGTVYRPLADEAGLVELTLVTRDRREPLVREFIRITETHNRSERGHCP
jgi:DNA-binding transcriptional LysR family regulator